MGFYVAKSANFVIIYFDSTGGDLDLPVLDLVFQDTLESHN